MLYKVASGLAEYRPFPSGTIAMQFHLLRMRVTMKNIQCSSDHDAETFSSSQYFLCVNNTEYPVYIYYTHP
jgi:hypothetical protein